MQNQQPQHNQNQGMGQKNTQNQQNHQNQQGPNGRLVVSIVISLIIGFVIGYGASWLWNRHRSAEMVGGTGTTGIYGTSTTPLVLAPSSSGISTTSAGSITVADQPAGWQVSVSKVTFGDNGGWVSIQDDTNGMPGRILGAALFAPGSTSGEVPLLRATLVDHSYFAVMRDNIGNYHLFNMQTDLPLTDPSGNMVAVSFMTR